MFLELESDLGYEYPSNGDLTCWCENGVLLLNRILTVRKSMPLSHKNKGWEIFTERIIKKIHNHNQDIEQLELKAKIKTYFEIKVKAFKLAQKQLKQTTKMMDIRLYSIKEYRTNLRLNKFGVVDTLIILSHVVIFIFIVVSEVIL